MDAQTVNSSYDLLSLAEHDTKLKRSGSYFVGACPFCGGSDRFTLKTTASGYRWHCRHCGQDKYHTAIDYIMRRDNLDFKTALSQLGGNTQHFTPRARTEPTQAPLALPGADWQKAALIEVWQACDRLETQAGKIARDYLKERAIELESTACAWQVGFEYHFDALTRRSRPAIVLPWWERAQDGADPKITAIKYRFVDDLAQDKKHRYTSRAGSVQVLYGLWDVLPTHNTLLLIEGEINALSAWQVLQNHGVSVLSFGGDCVANPAILQTIAGYYSRVFVWADNGEKAAKLRNVLPGASALKSPIIEGAEWDANKMLQAQLLPDFLSLALAPTAPG